MGKMYTRRLHVVRCDCGQEENDTDSIGGIDTRQEFEKWVRLKLGWSNTKYDGWMCPNCRDELAAETRTWSA